MDTTDAPQIIEHINQSLTFTPNDCKWIPCSARFAVLGISPKGKGIIQIYQLNKGQLSVLAEYQRPEGIKCGTFSFSPVTVRDFAVGDYKGNLTILDIETGKEKWNVQAHRNIINAIDGAGGKGHEFGAAEIVTGSRDGSAKIWDPRQDMPVVSLETAESEEIVPDCWAVCFGNSYNAEERVVAAGYDNGDVKLFDLKQSMIKWDANLGNGICGLEFDRKDIMMNKLGATTLESKFHVFDMKTFHPELGYAGLSELAHKSTIWGLKHLPQNRDIFLTQGGNGAINLYKYNYPVKRILQDENGLNKGVPGTLSLLNEKTFSTQPIIGFDWSPDKMGLGVIACLDQTCKVIIVTKLNLY